MAVSRRKIGGPRAPRTALRNLLSRSRFADGLARHNSRLCPCPRYIPLTNQVTAKAGKTKRFGQCLPFWNVTMPPMRPVGKTFKIAIACEAPCPQQKWPHRPYAVANKMHSRVGARVPVSDHPLTLIVLGSTQIAELGAS